MRGCEGEGPRGGQVDKWWAGRGWTDGGWGREWMNGGWGWTNSGRSGQIYSERGGAENGEHIYIGHQLKCIT